jgi:hypothetical protein
MDGSYHRAATHDLFSAGTLEQIDQMMNLKSFLSIGVALSVASDVASAQAARDSAGIRIVDNAKPTWTAGREWRLSTKPVDIGAGGGPNYELGRIAGVTRLSDGRLVVADESTLQLRFYDASGRFVKSVGGRGGGPGEFLRQFHAISRLPGDSIAAETQNGATIFSPNGSYVRNVEYGRLPGVPPFPPPGLLAWFDNGTAVVRTAPQGENRPGSATQWVDSSSLFLVDAAGAVVRPLGKTAAWIFVMDGTRPSPLDLGPTTLHAASGRAIHLAFPDEYAIRTYDSNWKLERIVRRAWTPRRLTRTDIDSYVDGWMAMWSKATGAEREAERKTMREEKYPELIPAFSAIVGTSTGELWVRESDLSGAPGCWCFAGLSPVPSKWSVFDPAGRWLGDVSMPPRFIPLEIGADYVLGRARDADDFPHAVMYRLEKPR